MEEDTFCTEAQAMQQALRAKEEELVTREQALQGQSAPGTCEADAPAEAGKKRSAACKKNAKAKDASANKEDEMMTADTSANKEDKTMTAGDDGVQVSAKDDQPGANSANEVKDAGKTEQKAATEVVVEQEDNVLFEGWSDIWEIHDGGTADDLSVSTHISS